jgi:uncharacterized protein YunC (DUF1805 family)
MTTLQIDGADYRGVHIPTGNSNILLIAASGGFLGCGYFDVAVANRLGDAAAIVTGVKTFDDMLEAAVARVSDAAAAAGVREGMTGRQALAILHRQG